MSKVKQLEKFPGQLGHSLVEYQNSFWEVSTINLKQRAKVEPFGPFASLLNGFFKRDDFIFETMVFKADKEGIRTSGRDYFLKRYPTAEEALIGHKKVVDGIESGEIKPRKWDITKDKW